MKNLKLSNIRKGFTLIELLVVIAIITVLAVLVFAALNPAGRLADTRDARRSSDVNEILTALQQCIVDNDGDPTVCGLSEPTALSQIGTCASGGATLCSGAAGACLNLDADTDLDAYLASFPIDPDSGASAATTGYAITYDANGILTVDSCLAENSTISVSR